MIEDMTDAILEIASEFTTTSIEKIEYNGVTYEGKETVATIRGSLQPLDPLEKEHVLNLGHTLSGKMKLYLPVSEGVLVEGDVITDTSGIGWKVIPEGITDFSRDAGYIKYILNKELV